MRKVFLKFLLGIDILVFAAYLICAEFLISYNAVTGVMSDGFGRELTEAPAIFSVIGLFKDWAGFGWFVVDTTVSFALICIAYLLFKAIRKIKPNEV